MARHTTRSNMHGPVLASLLALCLTASARAQQPPPAPKLPGAVPRVVCADTTYHFGTLSDQETAEHTFTIKNAGKADLLLLDVRTTCGCTTASLSRDAVPPGETAELKTAFDLRGRRGRETKKAFVRTNDPQTPTVAFTLEGTVTRTFLLDPRKVVFRPKSRAAEEEWSATVHLVIQHDEPFDITRIEPRQPAFFTADITERMHNEFKINVTLDRDYFIAKHRENGGFTIHTTHPRYKTLFVDVRAYVPAVVRIAPAALHADSPRGGPPPPEQTVVVRSEIPDAVELLDVEAPEGLQTRIQVLRHYIIRVNGFDADNAESLKGKTIRVKARIEGKERVLTIPIEVGE